MVETNLWTSIGISPSGSNIVACCKNNSTYNIKYSNNYGNTFNPSPLFSSSESINGISISDNNYVVMYTKTNIFISSDNGMNFIQSFNVLTTPVNPNNYWNGVSISSNGKYKQYIAACLGGISGEIYIASFNSNNSWTWNVAFINGKRNYTGISISETGKYIVTCYVNVSNNTGGIYTSSDNGETWVLNQTIPTNNINWSSICIKESYAIACDTSGKIYTSTDYGNIWTNTITTTNKFKKVCISNYGYAVALSDLQILVTSNYGDNWVIHSSFNSIITDIGVSTYGLLVTCNISNIYSSSIYSYYNYPSTYYSTDISFVTKGLLYDQLQITNILDTQFTINFQNPIIYPQNYQLYITDHINKDYNIYIPVSTENNYIIPIINLDQNTLYDISLQSIYSNNVVSTIYKTQYTKGAPEPTLIECNPDLITDVSMIVSFINCPITPNSYNIYLQNKGNASDKHNIYISKTQITTYLSQYQNNPNTPIITTINSVLPDSDYSLTIISNYSDVSYSSSFTTNVINTKSAPNNISYSLTSGNVTILYGHPSYVDPPNITLTLKNVTNNAPPIISPPQYLLTSYIFTDLSVNATYNITLQSNYSNMVINSEVITFTNVGKPKII